MTRFAALIAPVIARLNEQAPALPAFYHSQESIDTRLEQLANGECKHAVMQVRKHPVAEIDHDVFEVLLQAPKPTDLTVGKFSLLFGEHARELISPEVGLHFVETVCAGEMAAGTVLGKSSFQVFVNANPSGRALVEQGKSCQRDNGRGVDLNRNWDDHWDKNSVLDQETAPGPKPFSEGETRVLRDAISAFKPTGFLTVHSGTLGLYIPYAYDAKHTVVDPQRKETMVTMLQTIDVNHNLHSPYGPAGRTVGYDCPGTCLDWVFDNVPTIKHAFAAEVYVDPAVATQFAQEFAQQAIDDGLGLIPAYQPDAQSAMQGAAVNTPKWCMARFNPMNRLEYDTTVQKWTAAILSLAEQSASSEDVLGPESVGSEQATVINAAPKIDNSNVAAHSLAQTTPDVKPPLNTRWEAHLLLAFLLSAMVTIYVARDMIAAQPMMQKSLKYGQELLGRGEEDREMLLRLE